MAVSRLARSGSGDNREARTRVVRFGLWLGGAAVGGRLLVEFLTVELPSEQRALALAMVVMGCSFLGCGLVAWAQRPEKHIGRLMVLLGVVWLAGLWMQITMSGLLTTIAQLVINGWVILFVYFLVSFPSGRLVSRTDVLLLAPFVLAGVPMQIAWLMLSLIHI